MSKSEFLKGFEFRQKGHDPGSLSLAEFTSLSSEWWRGYSHAEEQWESQYAVEWSKAQDLEQHAYEHELECFGINDGWNRRPIDSDYAHEPAYLSGHRKGMTMDPAKAPR
jgi:hypothetical protein